MCRSGKIAADIGCDHAQLACFLAENVSSSVIASDVRDGPLEAARKTVSESGVKNVTIIKSDGLEKIDYADDVIICGMGGELIARIISGCRFLNADTRFILQPMTKANYLRCWLCENGYEIIEEKAALDGGFFYTVMLVSYTGVITEPNELFALIGKNTDSGYLSKVAEKLLKSAEGMDKSPSYKNEAARLRAIAEKILKKARENK